MPKILWPFVAAIVACFVEIGYCLFRAERELVDGIPSNPFDVWKFRLRSQIFTVAGERWLRRADWGGLALLLVIIGMCITIAATAI